jgi:HlyD family secretion protein
VTATLAPLMPVVTSTPHATAHDETDPAAPGAPVPRRSMSTSALLILATVTMAASMFVVFEIILPAYRRPTTGTYGTRLGYPAVLRHLGFPLPVKTTTVQRRRIVRSFLGEGTMASDPLLVPMVPLGTIVGVYVQPGQRVRKGDLLAELDARKGRLLAETARLLFMSAAAELRRVRIGSVILENREQPGRDAIDVKALSDEIAILKEEIATKEKLYEQSLVTKEQLLEARRTLTETEQARDTADLSLGMSTSGKNESERIAASAAESAQLQYQEALAELNEYKIVAPADGIIDRILVHVGEYNPTPGGLAFVVATGLWFQAYFDQTTIDEIGKGATAQVFLAARPDATFAGLVSNVNPIVSYTTGGPETARPVRAVGTDAPEWPSTFKVQIELAPDAISTLVPGLTGFARVTVDRTSVAVPEGAMISMSAGNGLLSIVDGATWRPRRVRYGAVFDGWIEVLDGASPGDKVIVEGQRALEADDRLSESVWQPPAAATP